MNFKLDCHSHTVASGHAYSTIYEYARAASEKGLELIAITDHGPKMPGGTYIFYFDNLKVIPDNICGVEILKGAEVNILDYDGNLDLPDRLLKNLNVIVASLHQPCIDVGDKIQNTKAALNAIAHPYVDILGHPDDDRIPLDYEPIIKAAVEYNVLIEVNNSSLGPKSFRVNAEENYHTILKLCRKYNAQIIVNSDAHYHMDIGSCQYARSLLGRLDFPEELVINCSPEKLKELLRMKRL